MIKYKLAKKLKDAGFPQHHPCGETVYDEFGMLCIYPITPKAPETNWFTIIPTLSELIEVCGKIGVKIAYIKDGRIYAEFDIDDGHGNSLDFCMDSLEEIYANLYLELNKK